ncbi:MAG: isoleucine--tRNA ligase [Rhodospirillaceae bacterium]|nr:isoleucine--tRNA ligase [Rhodospirillaceae bacterium]
MIIDYKSTIFLPKTNFQMKADFSELESKILSRWKEIHLFEKLRKQASGCEKFVLHDGPPYANGHLHIGHAFNKILKDVINRCQQMLGKDAHYVPGWDCHGLPIEWKIEEKYRKIGINKDTVDLIEFRKECRDFATYWIEIQKAEFQRLGIEGDWDNPYTTMSFTAEAQIVRELGKFVMNGGLYKGTKPVLWSVAEKTALAEAEVEYQDYTSIAIWVRFLIVKTNCLELKGASIVIWTTTPWTIPGNRAVAFNSSITYHVCRVDRIEKDSLAILGEHLVLSENLTYQVMKDIKVISFSVIASLSGDVFIDTVLSHPLRTHPEAYGGYEFDVPMLPGNFVTNDIGTGFVHIAPGHGEDDWYLGKIYDLTIPDTVMPDGAYYPSVPLFAGQQVLAIGKNGEYYSPVDKLVVDTIKTVGTLIHYGKIKHSYPHSWRSKAPLIFRTTSQWFISMKTNDLRDKALEAINKIRWMPTQGRNRIYTMVKNRPDWCISRQRAWGVPITVFTQKDTGKILRDQDVINRIATAVEAEGADCWFTSPPERFLGKNYCSGDWEQVNDVLDVWFDSGCTHAFVLKNEKWGLPWPASLYMEGSDQHRGWFHSSLLESCGTRDGHSPYEAVLTHGFVLDEKGRKMSKSLNNVIAPQEIIAKYGADILRLWVVCSNFSEDLRIGPEIINTQIDIYRRLRNTLRYLLGALNGFNEIERLDLLMIPPLERWVLHRLTELDDLIKQACHDFQFHNLFFELHNFCAVDLSAFYFDIRKDSLYCDHLTDIRRRATRTVMDLLCTCLTRWLAPFLCFIAEEAYLIHNSGNLESVHLEQFFNIPDNWRDSSLASNWIKIRDLRRVVTGALEIERNGKRIGSSLQAAPIVVISEDYEIDLVDIDLSEITITSRIDVERGNIPPEAFTLPDVPNVGVVFRAANGEKCQRCWKVLPDVGHYDYDGLCGRCYDTVLKYSMNN